MLLLKWDTHQQSCADVDIVEKIFRYLPASFPELTFEHGSNHFVLSLGTIPLWFIWKSEDMWNPMEANQNMEEFANIDLSKNLFIRVRLSIYKKGLQVNKSRDSPAVIIDKSRPFKCESWPPRFHIASRKPKHSMRLKRITASAFR